MSASLTEGGFCLAGPDDICLCVAPPRVLALLLAQLMLLIWDRSGESHKFIAVESVIWLVY